MLENTENVGMESQESVQNDDVQASGSNVINLSDMFATEEEAPEQETASQDPAVEQTEEPPVPKSLKGRLDRENKKGYDRGRAEAEAAWQEEKARYESELSEYREMKLQREAAELAKQENISEALALRLLRAERGVPAPVKQEQPRDSAGRFVSQDQKALQDRAAKLMQQARDITRAGGPDVYEMYKNTPEIQQRMIEDPDMDFYDVLREYRQDGGSNRKSMPPVVRNASGGAPKSRGFKDMSDEEFDKLNARLQEGYVIDTRR